MKYKKYSNDIVELYAIVFEPNDTFAVISKPTGWESQLQQDHPVRVTCTTKGTFSFEAKHPLGNTFFTGDENTKNFDNPYNGEIKVTNIGTETSDYYCYNYVGYKPASRVDQSWLAVDESYQLQQGDNVVVISGSISIGDSVFNQYDLINVSTAGKLAVGLEDNTKIAILGEPL